MVAGPGEPTPHRARVTCSKKRSLKFSTFETSLARLPLGSMGPTIASSGNSAKLVPNVVF